MNNLDLWILTHLNAFANQWPIADQLVLLFETNHLLKSGVLMAIWWGLWFRSSSADDEARRTTLMVGLTAMISGLFLARAMAAVLPFRERPFADPDLEFTIPAWNGEPPALSTWSSFPSDHAVVWFSVATCIWLIDRRWGGLALCYTLLLSLGRVYAGYHRPSDIFAGIGLGILLTWGLHSNQAVRRLGERTLGFGQTFPGLFYAGAFLCTYEIANMFNEVRQIGSLGWRIARSLL